MILAKYRHWAPVGRTLRSERLLNSDRTSRVELGGRRKRVDGGGDRRQGGRGACPRCFIRVGLEWRSRRVLRPPGTAAAGLPCEGQKKLGMACGWARGPTRRNCMSHGYRATSPFAACSPCLIPPLDDTCLLSAQRVAVRCDAMPCHAGKRNDAVRRADIEAERRGTSAGLITTFLIVTIPAVNSTLAEGRTAVSITKPNQTRAARAS